MRQRSMRQPRWPAICDNLASGFTATGVPPGGAPALASKQTRKPVSEAPSNLRGVRAAERQCRHTKWYVPPRVIRVGPLEAEVLHRRELERLRRARVGAREDEPVLVAEDVGAEPVGARGRAEEQEQVGQRDPLAVAQRDGLQLPVVAVQRADLGAVADQDAMAQHLYATQGGSPWTGTGC